MPPPIRVLQFICPAGFFGAEHWILALGRNLDGASVDCQLAVTRESEDQNIEVLHRFRGAGRPGHAVRMSGRFDPRVVLRLRSLLRRERIDLIHTHGYKSDILGLAAARVAGVKAIATPHGFENSRDRKLQLFIRLGCMALKHFDRVVPLSDELRADMDRIGVPDDRTRLIQNGVDLTEVDAVLASGRQSAPRDGERSLVYVGQLAPRKNLPDLLRAFDLLCRGSTERVRLRLVGEGPSRRELEDLARSLPAGDRIEFMGYREDRLEIVRQCDAFVMTSSLEGIPRAMMEAMALGLPAVAYDIPGVDKLILPGETGLLVPFGEVARLADAMEQLLARDDLARTLGQRARNHIVDWFSARRMAEEYTRLYRQVLGWRTS